MRGAPHLGFSAFKRRLSSRISLVTFGRPDCRDLHRQNRRKPARCQDTTVSGLTKMRASAQPEYSRRSAVQKNRSRRWSLGRGCFRLNTASCCRSAAASNASLWRGTKNARTYATIAITTETMAPILVEQRQRSDRTEVQPVDPSSGLGFDDPQVKRCGWQPLLP
jgi:hypothetical protein